MTDVWDLIDQKAAQYGQDAQTARQIATVETGGRNEDSPSGTMKGVFQFNSARGPQGQPSTWDQYGNGADPHDVAANVDAGMRLLRDNRAGLVNALGREPTPGELYLAHQQGLGGAEALLANPAAPAASIVGTKAIVSNGGRQDMTAGEYAAMWSNKLAGARPSTGNASLDAAATVSGQGGSTGGSGGYVPRPLEYGDLMALPPADPLASEHNAQDEAHHPGFVEAMRDLGDYYSAETTAGRTWYQAGLSQFAPDPNFAPTTADIKRYATDPVTGQTLPPEYMSRLGDASSDAQARQIAHRSWAEINAVKTVEGLGWGDRWGIKFASMALDLPSLAIAAVTGGAISPALSGLMRFGLAGRVAAGGVEGAAGNVAVTAAQHALGAPTTPSDYLAAAGQGMILGGAFGPLAHNPAMRDTANGMAAAGESLKAKAAEAAADAVDAPARPAPSASTGTPRFGELGPGSASTSASPKAAASFNRFEPPGRPANDTGIRPDDTFDAIRAANDASQQFGEDRDRLGLDGHGQGEASFSHAGTGSAHFVPELLGNAWEDFRQWHTDGKVPVNDDGYIITAANDPYSYPAARPGLPSFVDGIHPSVIPEGGMWTQSPDAHAMDAAHDLGAAAVPFAKTPLYLQTGEWSNVRDAGQYTSNLKVDGALKSNVVFPASGTQTASSPFAEHRIMGANLAGNPIGYRDIKNPWSAAERSMELRGKLKGQVERFLTPAYAEWSRDMGHGFLAKRTSLPDFMAQVHDYVTGSNPAEDYHPAVKRFADGGVRPVMADIARELRESGLAPELSADPAYLPRIYDPNKIGGAYERFGAKNLGLLFKAALKDMDWVQGMPEDRLETMAHGMAEGMAKRALDLDDDWSRAWAGKNLDKLQSVLMDDAHMTWADANDIVQSVKAKVEDPSHGSARLKSRIDLDPSASINVPDVGTLSIGDLVHKDVGHLLERYIDKMSGKIELAKTRMVDPDTGTVLTNGLKSEADFKKMMVESRRNIQEQYIDKAATPAARKNLERWRDQGEANLQFMWDRINSKPTDFASKNPVASQALRILRKYSFDRVMGAAGWSHLPMFGAMLAHGGFRAAFEHVPAFRHIVNQDGEWMLKHGLDREIEAFMGRPTDPLRGTQLHDWGMEPTGYGRTPGLMNRAEHVLNQTNKVTAMASGLAHIIDLNRRWVVKGTAQHFADMARKVPQLPDGSFNLDGKIGRRVLQMGLDGPDLQSILGQVKAHATTDRGILFDHTLTSLNLDKWDQATAYNFQMALSRTAARVIQENDIGSMARWSSSPMWQMMMQFRNFPMVATTKQLTYNIGVNDPKAWTAFATACAFGALSYIMREKITSIGRDDRADYLEKRLTPYNIGMAALQHSGYLGMATTAIDSGLKLFGGQPLFDYRSTGNSNALWTPPALTLSEDWSKAMEAVRRPWQENRSRSQGEVRSLLGLLPESHTLPATLLTNAMVRGLPAFTPRPPRD